MSESEAKSPETAANIQSEPAPKPSSRRVMFDLGRLLAAYAIVWLHTPRNPVLTETTVIARFAVPFFVFATIFFTFDSLTRHPQRRFSEYAKNRFLRIYVPFLAWSAIYLAFKGVKSVLLPEQPNDYPGIELLWTGSFYHLWFMPFILAVSLMAFLVAKLIRPFPVLDGPVCLLSALAAVILAAVRLPMVPADESKEYVYLVFNAAPAVLGGIAFAVSYRRFGTGWESLVGTLHGVALFAMACFGLCYLGRHRLFETLAGFGFLLIALCPARPAPLARIATLGSLAYGIYLGHLLFIKIAEALAAKLGLSVTWPLDIGIFLFAAAGSTASAHALARFRVTRWMAA